MLRTLTGESFMSSPICLSIIILNREKAFKFHFVWVCVFYVFFVWLTYKHVLSINLIDPEIFLCCPQASGKFCLISVFYFLLSSLRYWIFHPKKLFIHYELVSIISLVGEGRADDECMSWIGEKRVSFENTHFSRFSAFIFCVSS